MDEDAIVRGFHLAEVRSPSPVVADLEDDLVATKLFMKVAARAGEQTPRAARRRSTKSAKVVHRAKLVESTDVLLQPGDSHLSRVKLNAPALVLVRATWVGTGHSLKLTATHQGEAPLRAKATRVPPNRGTTLLTNQFDAGVVQLSMKNPDRDNELSVQLVVGTLPIPPAAKRRT